MAKKEDKERKAKPEGYRFKGEGENKRPLVSERGDSDVYFESRKNRSDKNLTKKFAEGGTADTQEYKDKIKLITPYIAIAKEVANIEVQDFPLQDPDAYDGSAYFYVTQNEKMYNVGETNGKIIITDVSEDVKGKAFEKEMIPAEFKDFLLLGAIPDYADSGSLATGGKMSKEECEKKLKKIDALCTKFAKGSDYLDDEGFVNEVFDVVGRTYAKGGKPGEPKLGYFIQMESDRPKEARYYQIGIKMPGGFTGMVRDYMGGGSYDTLWAFEGETIDEEDEEGESIERDDMEGIIINKIYHKYGQAYAKKIVKEIKELEDKLFDYTSYGSVTYKGKIKPDNEGLVISGAEFPRINVGSTIFRKSQTFGEGGTIKEDGFFNKTIHITW